MFTSTMKVNGYEIEPRADLSGANLRGADLYGADLRWANLTGADLRWANLTGADLTGANLTGANLRGANLRGANLFRVDLTEANLCGANLFQADLRWALNIPKFVYEETLITPEGDIIGWKKCFGGVIVKLLIPKEAKRHNATGRKCRAEYAKVLEVIGDTHGVSLYDKRTTYRVGETVRCDIWNEDRWNECSGGIHFFLSRGEAERY